MTVYRKGIGDMNDPSAIVIGIEPNPPRPNLDLKQYARETILGSGIRYHFWEFEAFYRDSMGEEFPNLCVEVLFGKERPEYFSSVLLYNPRIIDLLGSAKMRALEVEKELLLKTAREIQAKGQLNQINLDKIVEKTIPKLKLRVEDKPIRVIDYDHNSRIFAFEEEVEDEEPLEALSKMYGINARKMVHEVTEMLGKVLDRGLLDIWRARTKGELN